MLCTVVLYDSTVVHELPDTVKPGSDDIDVLVVVRFFTARIVLSHKFGDYDFVSQK